MGYFVGTLEGIRECGCYKAWKSMGYFREWHEFPLMEGLDR
jgi:hypothetical protein